MPTPPTDDVRSWRIRLDIDELARIEAELERFLADHEVRSKAAYAAQVIVEEIVRNLIEHTPPYATEEEIEVDVAIAPANVTIVVRDERPPFSPEDAPVFDPSMPLEARRAGGMGVHLVRSMSDELTYERQGICNVLTSVVARG